MEQMETITLVDNPRAVPRIDRTHRHPVSHRAPGRRTTTNTPARQSVAPVSSAASAPTARPQAEGKVYRTTYLPPSLHVALVALWVLTLVAGVAAGVGFRLLLER